MKRYLLFLNVLGIVTLSFATAFLATYGLYFTALMVGLGIVGLALSLYNQQQKSIKYMERLIAHIHYADLSLSYPVSASKGNDKKLVRSMNEALAAFRIRLHNSIVAEAESEAWQKLIRVLTHEIMNSIAPVISLSETVTERAAQNGMNKKDYAVMLQAIQTIHRRSKSLLDFVDNYRKLTRIPLPRCQNFVVSELFNDIKMLYHFENTTITFFSQPTNLTLYADRSLIEQVLINLLINSVEACGETSSPLIKVEAQRQVGMVAISVSDNGSGIVPEAIDQVFVPFFTTKTKGSGIGLSVCRQIINRHGGIISVMSEMEKGTTFTLSFPIRMK